MKVKPILLQEYLDQTEMSAEKLSNALDVDVSEVEKLLSGEAVSKKTALEFIEYFGADKAQELIDWDAIGKQNPLACEADEEE